MPNVVLDASTVVSGILFPQSTPAMAIRKARSTDVLCVSPEVIEEYQQVLSRPKFERFLSATERNDAVAALVAAARLFDPLPRVTDCRDPKDNKYLDLALAARADVVTGDQDLLVLDPWRGFRILSAADYLALR